MNRRDIERAIWDHLACHLGAMTFEEIVWHALIVDSSSLSNAEQDRVGEAIQRVTQSCHGKGTPRTMEGDR